MNANSKAKSNLHKLHKFSILPIYLSLFPKAERCATLDEVDLLDAGDVTAISRTRTQL